MIKQILKNSLGVVKIIFISFVVVFLIRYFIAQPFLVQGSSMEPNFASGEYLIVDEISYRFREPVRGEVIVFQYPNDPSQYYIKRIVGLPGESLKIDGQKIFIVEGDIEREVQQNYSVKKDFNRGNFNISLGDDEYFVMGDNRGVSFDSREWGALKEEKITGRVLVRMFPFGKIKLFGSN